MCYLCAHLQALYLGQTGGVGAASTNQGGPGYTYTRCAYPNAGWNGVRPGIGMYCGTRPGIIRTVLGSTITAARVSLDRSEAIMLLLPPMCVAFSLLGGCMGRGAFSIFLPSYKFVESTLFSLLSPLHP